MMNKEPLKLINILKTDEEIKENIEELRFGCIVCDNMERGFSSGYYKFLYDDENHFVTFDSNFRNGSINMDDSDDINIENLEIIGQIEERHLRWFLENKGYNLIIHKREISIEDENRDCDYMDSKEYNSKKSLMEQSEEFYKRLNEFLITEFNIKGLEKTR